jgi:ribonuclease HIII
MEDARLSTLKRQIGQAGWSWRTGKDIAYGTQLIVSDGSYEATIDFYPKRGRSVIGGADSALRRSLSAMVTRLEAAAPAPAGPTARPAAGRPTVPTIAGAHIGMDESGKGDWYGPLVVAAVYVDAEAAPALRRAGVRDSKTIESAALPEIAARIEQLVPASARWVTVLDPEVYNQRYAGLLNINLLLAELYAETALPVHQVTRSAQIVCDQFAQRADRLDRSFATAGLPKPTQLHHAESASVAVAAASVLASARFAAELVRLGGLAGLRGQLPAGASAIRELRAAARHILAREGREGLRRYAKLNFKPVQEIYGADGPG